MTGAMIEQELTKELGRIIDAIDVTSSDSLVFAGQRFAALAPGNPPAPGQQPAQNGLVGQLQLLLYQHCYCSRFRGVLTDAPASNTAPDSLLPLLSAANGGQDQWNRGWRIDQLMPTGQVEVSKANLRRVLLPGEFLTHDGPGVPLRVGSTVSIFVPKESMVLQPGFYFAFGQTVGDQQDESNVMRFHWNISESGAAPLLQRITKDLNRFQVPFRFKCLINPSQYGRADAAVLYLAKKHYQIVIALLEDIYALVMDSMNTDTCLFSKPLAPGLSLVEDPNNGESFGMNRCRIFAEGIWNAFAKGLTDRDSRLHEVKQRFALYELDFSRPYLNGQSVDQYALPHDWSWSSHDIAS